MSLRRRELNRLRRIHYQNAVFDHETWKPIGLGVRASQRKERRYRRTGKIRNKEKTNADFVCEKLGRNHFTLREFWEIIYGPAMEEFKKRLA